MASHTPKKRQSKYSVKCSKAWRPSLKITMYTGILNLKTPLSITINLWLRISGFANSTNKANNSIFSEEPRATCVPKSSCNKNTATSVIFGRWGSLSMSFYSATSLAKVMMMKPGLWTYKNAEFFSPIDTESQKNPENFYKELLLSKKIKDGTGIKYHIHN